MSTLVPVSSNVWQALTKQQIAKLITDHWNETQLEEWKVIDVQIDQDEVAKKITRTIGDRSEADEWVKKRVEGQSADRTHKLALIYTYIEGVKEDQVDNRQQGSRQLEAQDFLDAIKNMSLQQDMDRINEARQIMQNKNVLELPKDCKLPTFHGNQEEDVDDWLYMVNSFVITRKVPDDDVLPMISPLLRGHAMHALRKFQNDFPREQYNWNKFSQILRIRFETSDGQRKLRSEL